MIDSMSPENGDDTEDYYDNSIEGVCRSRAIINLKAFRLFLSVAQLSRDKQRTELLGDSDIAILLFFCSLFESIVSLKFPIINLELDCRGEVSFRASGKTWNVDIGEIKSRSSLTGLAKAALQLNVRLLAIKEAMKIIYGQDLRISLEGKIFLPSSIFRGDKVIFDRKATAVVRLFTHYLVN